MEQFWVFMERFTQEMFSLFRTWDSFGVGIFLIVVIGSITTAITTIFRYITIWFRGWPPAEVIIDEEDENEEDENEDDE
jgi:hypothetical protein